MNIDEIEQGILTLYGESLRPLLSELDDIITDNGELINSEARTRIARILALKYAQESTGVRSTIVWVLGKFRLPEMKSFFDFVLREEVDKPSDVLWQAIIALDNLGIPIMPEGGGGILDRQKNAETARRYIEGLDQSRGGTS